MNNRNELDKRNYLAFLEYFGLLFYASVIVLIVVSIVFVQSGRRNTLKTKENDKVEKPTTECKDWQSDSTVSIERRNVYKYWQR